MRRTLILSLLSLSLAGCSAHTPILYPNEHYQQVGAEAAQSDIKDCTPGPHANGLAGKPFVPV